MMDVDVIVAGSGSAGMTTAIVAAKSGLKVLLVEKTPFFGGTTSWSGGGCWIPNNHQMAAIGASDTPEAAMTYLKAVVGNRLRQDLAEAFLANGPEMVDFMLANTSVQMAVRPQPDYFPELPGGAKSGRAFSPVMYDARELGRDVKRLRLPLEQFNAPWGMMVNLQDVQHGMAAHRSVKSAWHIAKLFARLAADKVRYGRGTRLTMGNAMSGRFLKSAIDAGVTLWENSPIVDIMREGDAVLGAVIKHDGAEVRVHARKGVVLATGGFAANKALRQKHYATTNETMTIAPEGNTGDGMTLGLGAGGAIEESNADNGVWIVVSRYKEKDGTITPIPHILDFGRPGIIVVNRDGKRFANEATLFVGSKMNELGFSPAWAILDDKFLKKWGLGLVLPNGIRLKRLLREGYLYRGTTLSALAEKIKVNAASLTKTVQEANSAARAGEGDPVGKGTGGWDRYLGDQTNKPHPNLGPIENGPFYAIQIVPADISSTLGMRVSAHGEVLDENKQPIKGLYACGLDTNSIWAGLPPANGANNGPNMTFGYIVGRTLAGQPVKKFAQSAGA